MDWLCLTTFEGHMGPTGAACNHAAADGREMWLEMWGRLR